MVCNEQYLWIQLRDLTFHYQNIPGVRVLELLIITYELLRFIPLSSKVPSLKYKTHNIPQSIVYGHWASEKLKGAHETVEDTQVYK